MTEIDGITVGDLHPALVEVVTYLSGFDVDVMSPHHVMFDIAEGLVDADIKEGSETVRIRVNLVDDAPEAVAEDVVINWVTKQPDVVGGTLQACVHQDEDGTIFGPRIVFETPIGEYTTVSGVWKNHRGETSKFGDAWRQRGVADATVHDPMVLRAYRFPPSHRPFVEPQNAWLLMGDSATRFTDEQSAKFQGEGRVGIYNTTWTAPKNIEVGDLVLFYFVSPVKAVHFVARAASRAFWRDDIEVNADGPVGDKQWWAYFTPPVEIEPITYAQLRDAQNGHLNLRGRSGHFLHRETIGALRFCAKFAHQQEDVHRIAQQPVGRTDLPTQDEVTFTQWQSIAAGALPLEADVSNYIVEPMLRWAMDQDAVATRVLSGWEREYRVSSGYVDFVLHGNYPLPARPRLAIEAKLAVRRPRSGRWNDSPDFRQLRRYMDELDVPGMLVDAHGILLVAKGGDAPCLEMRRSDVSEDELMAMLRYFPLNRRPVQVGGVTRWEGGISSEGSRPVQRRARRRS